MNSQLVPVNTERFWRILSAVYNVSITPFERSRQRFAQIVSLWRMPDETLRHSPAAWTTLSAFKEEIPTSDPPPEDAHEIESAIVSLEERAKKIAEAIHDANEAEKKAHEELDKLPTDLARLREKLRSVGSFPIADQLER